MAKKLEIELGLNGAKFKKQLDDAQKHLKDFNNATSAFKGGIDASQYKKNIQEAKKATSNFEKDTIQKLKSISNYKLNLKLTVQNKKAWQDSQKELKKLALEIKNTQNPTKKLQKDFENLRNTTKKNKEAYQFSRIELSKVRKELNNTGINTKKLTIQQAKLRAEMKKFNTSLSKSKLKTDMFKNSIMLSRLSIAGIVAGLGAMTTASVKAAAQFEQTSISFQVLLGDAEKAKNLLTDLQDFANITPFSSQGLADNAKLLLSFGESLQDIMPDLRMFGDISGGNQQKLNSLTLAFAQMSSAGRLMGQDLLQMINAGFNPLQIISQKTGKSMGTLRKEMEKGAISASLVKQAFKDATSQGGKFYGMMEKQSSTVKGKFSTLKDSATLTAKAFGNILLPATKNLLDSTIYLSDQFRKVVETMAGMDDISKKLNQSFDTQKSHITKLTQTINTLQTKTNKTVEEEYNLKQAKKDLIDLYPDLKDQIEDEITKYGKLEKAIISVNEALAQKRIKAISDYKVNNVLFKQVEAEQELSGLRQQLQRYDKMSIEEFNNYMSSLPSNKVKLYAEKDKQNITDSLSDRIKEKAKELEDLKKEWSSFIDSLNSTESSGTGNQDYQAAEKGKKDPAITAYEQFNRKFKQEIYKHENLLKARKTITEKYGLKPDDSYFNDIAQVYSDHFDNISKIQVSKAKNKNSLLKQEDQVFNNELNELYLKIAQDRNKNEKDNDKEAKDIRLQAYFDEEERKRQAYEKTKSIIKDYEDEQLLIQADKFFDKQLMDEGYNKYSELFKELKQLRLDYWKEVKKIEEDGKLSQEQKQLAIAELNKLDNERILKAKTASEKLAAEELQKIWGNAYSNLFNTQQSFADISKKLMLDLAIYYAKLGLANFATGAGQGSNLGKIANSGLTAIKLLGFASGGNPPIGIPYIVGENGPEIRVDSKPGTIIPNHLAFGQNQEQNQSQNILINYNPQITTTSNRDEIWNILQKDKTIFGNLVSNAIKDNAGGARSAVGSV